MRKRQQWSASYFVRLNFHSTYIGELHDAHLAEVSKTIMGCILVQDHGDILHRLGTEPLRHRFKILLSSNQILKTMPGKSPKETPFAIPCLSNRISRSKKCVGERLFFSLILTTCAWAAHGPATEEKSKYPCTACALPRFLPCSQKLPTRPKDPSGVVARAIDWVTNPNSILIEGE